MQIRLVGSDLPGTSCGPSPERPEGHHNIHVGVQRKNRPYELLGLVRGDAPSACWTLECTATPSDRSTNGVDVRGPYISGPPGGRFIYLSWVTVDGAAPGDQRMFRRAKLALADVPSDVLQSVLAAGDDGVLVGRFGLTDHRGNPTCAGMAPSQITWSAEQ
jgi:hypothetical protein